MMSKVYHFSVALAALGLVAASDHAIARQPGARADAVLMRAQSAVGGAAALQAIVEIRAEGTLRRLVDGVPSTHEMHIELISPDEFVRQENSNGAMHIEHLQGDEASERVTENGVPAGSKGLVRFRSGRDATPDEINGARRERLVRERDAYVLGWLLRPAGDLTYEGRVSRTRQQADVIAVHRSTLSAMRLYVRSEDGLPMQVSLRGGGPRTARPGERVRSSGADSDQVDMVFSDYRTVGSVRLPHKVTWLLNSALQQEWTIKRFDLAP